MTAFKMAREVLDELGVEFKEGVEDTEENIIYGLIAVIGSLSEHTLQLSDDVQTYVDRLEDMAQWNRKLEIDLEGK